MSDSNIKEVVAHNSYFDGAVQSLVVDGGKRKATVGVMKAGKFTFGTSAPEEMVVILGELNVKLPGADWAVYSTQQTFTIDADQSFDVSCEKDVAYICYYG